MLKRIDKPLSTTALHTTPPDPVRVRLLWHAQAQFAGYHVAEHEGLGASRGIALSNSPVDFGEGPIAALLNGSVDFSVASPSHLLESPHAADLVMVLAIQQQSALVYPAHRARGIRVPADLEGRTIGVWPGREDLELRWMLARCGVRTDSIRMRPMNDTVGPFLAGDVDCAQMTTYHELHRVADALGGDAAVTLFRAADHGAGLIKDGLVTTKRLAREQPERVQAVVESVLEGWAIAFDEPVRAVDACLAADRSLDRDTQRRQLEDIRALSMGGRALGFPDPRHVARAAEAMATLGHRIDADVVASAVDTRYWQAAADRLGPALAR